MTIIHMSSRAYGLLVRIIGLDIYPEDDFVLVERERLHCALAICPVAMATLCFALTRHHFSVYAWRNLVDLSCSQAEIK
jgi:hypothetical protein